MASAYAIATLAVFILSIFCVIHPVKIPTPHPALRIPLNLTTAPILAIAVLWAAQCIDSEVIRNGFVGTEGVKPYNIIILFFSLAYMAISLDITGILRAAALWVSIKGGKNGWKLYLYLYVMLTVVSILLGNDPVVLSGTAFLVYYTQATGLDPTAWVMAEFAAANTASMVLFVGNPTNVVICEGFSVNNAAFTAYTILPFVACNIFCFVALAFQYRSKVPRELKRTAQRDPRSAIRDPVAAWVGSFMLGATLVLCLVVSFFGVDVWMISLPFAFGKFLFDLAWDRYRASRGLLIGLPEKDFEVDPTKEQTEKAPSRTISQATDEETTTASLPDIGQKMEHSISSHGTDVVVPQSKTVPLTAEPKPFDADPNMPRLFQWYSSNMNYLYNRIFALFPTFMTALPRLPFALVPFAFSQFILIEALNHQGWVNIFAAWLVRASQKQVYPTVWLIGVLGVILCNISGTNIGATILLTKVVRAAALPYDANRAAAIALAVASNIGAVSFTFSASLAGLLWRSILEQKGVSVRQRDFAFWNMLPLLAMTTVGLGIVSAEMAVLFPSRS